MPDRSSPGVERPTIDVTTPGGWPAPWPNVAEIAAVLPTDKWTLVGGLMTQLHSIHHGLGVVRPMTSTSCCTSRSSFRPTVTLVDSDRRFRP